MNGGVSGNLAVSARYVRAVGYNYEAVKIFMPASAGR
jgi:hypothetical protein